MNIVLWVLQGLLGLAFSVFGYNHGFNVERGKTRPMMAWMGALPRGLMTFIGCCEILGAIGLVLPGLTGIQAWLTPLAAALLALMMLLAALFHLPRHEYPNMVGNLVLLALAAFVAYGRFVLARF